ncbi:SsgA family sporulation/cell division regulator [Streptomyces beijiangensis]|uniref:SsgA family sporulation/cell division regulator n=1 Tax=Streptomyces beijiangensis TaxID=163361 RepID=A0A939FAK3_9ACTN|nr:SsgA family sporulation/cell division regulator [Streptomyces beijiangensis]MBO0514644.1 SsgA family sporulation/cell division regulator [Streptomyces beijiangensis]
MSPASTAIEGHTRGQIISDAIGHRSVPVALRYDPSAGPADIHVVFPGGSDWAFSRELLITGLRTPVRSGNVGMWPCGRVQTVLEFHSDQGAALVQFDSSALIRFLRRTYENEEVPRALSGHGGRLH